MKTLTLLASTLLAFASSALAGTGDFVLKKVDVQFVTTPQYSGSPPDRQVKPSKWMMIDVTFDALPEFTNELTLNYYILFARRTFVGHVNHVSIQKGRDLHSVAFMSPKAIAQIMQGKQVTNADLDNVTVTITAPGVSAPVSIKSLKGAPGEWWAAQKQEEGFVLNKSETPWGPLSWDYYEAVKPSASR